MTFKETMDYSKLISKTTVYENPFEPQSAKLHWPTFDVYTISFDGFLICGDPSLYEGLHESQACPFDTSSYKDHLNDLYYLPERGLVTERGQCMSTLPIEFFNHEILKVDTQDAASLSKFTAKWGVALSPLRFAIGELIQLDYGGIIPKQLLEQSIKAIESTDRGRYEFASLQVALGLAGFRDHPLLVVDSLDVVSVDEVSTSIAIFQKMRYSI